MLTADEVDGIVCNASLDFVAATVAADVVMADTWPWFVWSISDLIGGSALISPCLDVAAGFIVVKLMFCDGISTNTLGRIMTDHRRHRNWLHRWHQHTHQTMKCMPSNKRRHTNRTITDECWRLCSNEYSSQRSRFFSFGFLAKVFLAQDRCVYEYFLFFAIKQSNDSSLVHKWTCVCVCVFVCMGNIALTGTVIVEPNEANRFLCELWRKFHKLLFSRWPIKKVNSSITETECRQFSCKRHFGFFFDSPYANCCWTILSS